MVVHLSCFKPISGLASALALGAAGAWVGTRFMMTPEAKTTDAYKARLLEASSDDTVITRAFTGSPLRALQNSYTKHFAAHPEELGVGGLQVGGQRACRGACTTTQHYGLHTNTYYGVLSVWCGPTCTLRNEHIHRVYR